MANLYDQLSYSVFQSFSLSIIQSFSHSILSRLPPSILLTQKENDPDMFEPLLEDDDEVLKVTAVGVYKVFYSHF